MYDSDDIEVREVAGGRLGWNSPPTAATLAELEERMADVERTWASVEAAAVRVREAQAADAAQEERRYRELLRRPQASSPEVGKVWSDAIFGTSATVRESSVHPLGRVISGAHSHGSVRHTHDRLPGDHLHCMHCGGDSRLCLDNPHHAEGVIPTREANTAAESSPWVEAMNAIYDGRTSSITPAQAMGQMWQQEHAGQGGKQLGAAFERAILHGDLGPAAR